MSGTVVTRPGLDGKTVVVSMLAAGPPGPRGTSGADGAAGSQGVAGLPGLAGADGIDGQAGTTGANGTDGRDGQDGPTGPKGDAGEKGDSGARGIDGVNGVDGLAAVGGGLNALRDRSVQLAVLKFGDGAFGSNLFWNIALSNSASYGTRSDSVVYPAGSVTSSFQQHVAPSIPGASVHTTTSYPVSIEAASDAPPAPKTCFDFSIVFGLSNTPSGAQVFAGLGEYGTAAAYTSDWNAVTRMIGVGFEGGGNNLQMISKTSSGLVRFDTGVSRASQAGGLLQLTGKQVRGTREIKLTLRDIIAGIDIVADWSAWLETPSAGVAPQYHVAVGIGNCTPGGGANRTLVVQKIYIEMDY